MEIKAECPKSCLSLYVDHFPSLNGMCTFTCVQCNTCDFIALRYLWRLKCIQMLVVHNLRGFVTVLLRLLEVVNIVSIAP